MNLHKIAWEDSVWFADIDDTLIATAAITPQASDGIRQVLELHIGKDAAVKVQNNFNEIFNLMILGLRNKTEEDWKSNQKEKEDFRKLWKQIEDCQKEIKNKYGEVKKFSREVFIKIAAEKENLMLNPDIIYKAADRYWLRLSEKSRLFPGVIELVQEIRQHKRPLYLMTSSDARLELKENGQFAYDPSHSEKFKRERVQLLREKGIDFNAVSIGDPEDKPHLDFFNKGIKMAEQDLGQQIDLSKAIIVGDSFGADLQTPKEQMGFGLAVLFQESKSTTEIVDDHYLLTGNLLNITKFIS